MESRNKTDWGMLIGLLVGKLIGWKQAEGHPSSQRGVKIKETQTYTN